MRFRLGPDYREQQENSGESRTPRTATLAQAAAATSGRIVVAEDHHPEGGLGSAVSEGLLESGRTNLHLAHLAVRGMPGSGTGAELMAWAGIDADHIAAAARELVGA
jgi:transketolase